MQKNQHPRPCGTKHRPVRQGLAAACLFAGVALLPSLAGADPVGNAYDQTRKSSFTYNANGMLASETVEPDDAQFCVATSYTYDTYGNRVTSKTANCAGAVQLAQFDERNSSNTFAAQTADVPTGRLPFPAGTFATSARVALTANIADDNTAHFSATEYDPRFGVPTKQTAADGLVVTAQYDSFGRKVMEIRPDGTRTRVSYCFISARVGGADSSNSGTCPSPGGTEIPALAVRFEHVDTLRSDGTTAIAAFSRTYYDRAGRVLRKVTQAYDGADQPSAPGSLIVQDNDYTAHGAVLVSTQPYFLTSGSSNTSGSNNAGLTLTQYDALGRPKAVYVTDPSTTWQTGGSHASITFGTRGSHRAAGTLVSYNGLQTTTTNDQGLTRTEEKNPNGEVARVTDERGAQIVLQHDAYGNLAITKDSSNNRVTVQYDRRGRKVRMSDPDAGVMVYCYDALGQLKAQQSSAMRNSHTPQACPTNSGTGSTAPTVTNWTTLAYDRLGRLTSRVEFEFTSTWSYDVLPVGSAVCGDASSTKGRLCQSSTSHGMTRKQRYDTLGRLVSSRTDISGGPTMSSAYVYHAHTGRLAKETLPTGLQASYDYTTRGYLRSVQNTTELIGGVTMPANQKLWEARAYNAWGRVEKHTNANGVESRATYEPRSGRLSHLTAGPGTANSVLHQRLRWDSLNRLVWRIDGIGAGSTEVQDSFSYDTLGRLTKYEVSGSGVPNSRTVTLQYDAMGKLTYKSDVGSYTYPAQGVVNGQPHAVTSISGGAYSNTYTYDRNGNVESASAGKWRRVGYTTFNLPNGSMGIQGAAGTPPSALPRYNWRYDERHARVEEEHVSTAGTRKTWFYHPDNAGGMTFEREVPPSGAARNRHYLSAGGGVFAVIITEGALPTLASGAHHAPGLDTMAAAKLEYWYKDHLGSTVATTNHSGTVTARYSYDPYGKRRNTTGEYDGAGAIVVDWGAPTSPGNDRGYTGHEHLDDVGVVHMNGRIFEPTIARFMQADPFIQSPHNLQNYDRYGYCFSSPATCTDPSGLVFEWAERKFRKELRRSAVMQQVGSLAIAAFSAYCGPFASLCNGAGQAAWAGYAGASTSDALRTGFRAGLSTEVNRALGGIENGWANAAGHAAWGCAEHKMNGGNCSDGVKGALAYSALKGLGLTAKMDGHIVVNTMLQASAGGLVSVATGGEFWPAARTAAYAYLFNCLSTGSGNCGDPNSNNDVEGAAVRDPQAGLKFALEVAPGGAAVECLVEGCGAIGWAIASVDAIPGGGKIAGKGLKYAHSIRAKALLDPLGHNFPHSFDDVILATKPIVQSDKTLLYVVPGHVNSKAGFYTIVVRPDTNTMIHRAFQERYKVK